jgi:hypothetical protein
VAVAVVEVEVVAAAVVVVVVEGVWAELVVLQMQYDGNCAYRAEQLLLWELYRSGNRIGLTSIELRQYRIFEGYVSCSLQHGAKL